MEGSAGLSKGLKDERCWRGFKQGPWCTTIDVRGFIDRLRPVYPGPWGIEALNKAQRAWPLEELTTRAFATTRAMFRD